MIVFVLGLFISFFFAVISFAFFHGLSDAQHDLLCKSLKQCFAIFTLDGLLGTLENVRLTTSSQQRRHSFPSKCHWHVAFIALYM